MTSWDVKTCHHRWWGWWQCQSVHIGLIDQCDVGTSLNASESQSWWQRWQPGCQCLAWTSLDHTHTLHCPGLNQSNKSGPHTHTLHCPGLNQSNKSRPHTHTLHCPGLNQPNKSRPHTHTLHCPGLNQPNKSGPHTHTHTTLSRAQSIKQVWTTHTHTALSWAQPIKYPLNQQNYWFESDCLKNHLHRALRCFLVNDDMMWNCQCISDTAAVTLVVQVVHVPWM